MKDFRISTYRIRLFHILPVIFIIAFMLTSHIAYANESHEMNVQIFSYILLYIEYYEAQPEIAESYIVTDNYTFLSGLSKEVDEKMEFEILMEYDKEIGLHYLLAMKRIVGKTVLGEVLNRFVKDGNKDIDWNDVQNELITASPNSKEKLEKTFEAFTKAEDMPKYSLLGATLHQDDDKKPPFSITGELHREGPQCDIYNIPYRIILKDGEVFEGSFDMPGKIASFEIGLATQPVSIEIDPGFEMFRYIPEEDRSEDEILNSSLTEKFSFIVMCVKGACFTQEIE